MKRKLHRLFEENSQDETSLPAHSDSSHSIISWKLESLESENSSFDLNFNQNNICIVGRKDLSNSKYISVIHCEIFQNSFGELFLSSKARYDVIYIDNILALKDIPILLKEGCIIRFCKGHFSFKLQKNIVENCERNSTVDMPLENHVIITQNEMRERMDMSLEDIDARVRTRHIRELDITNSICRKILSSFYCDICIEVIASCRSCVPCGHNFCFPCITQYISISKGYTLSSLLISLLIVVVLRNARNVVTQFNKPYLIRVLMQQYLNASQILKMPLIHVLLVLFPALLQSLLKVRILTCGHHVTKIMRPREKLNQQLLLRWYLEFQFPYLFLDFLLYQREQ